MNRYKSYGKGWHFESQRHSLAARGIRTRRAWKDQIKGGLADKKHPSDFNRAALEKGIKVEMEHTGRRSVAMEIAMDHLTENPKYYDYLEDMEKKMDKKKSMALKDPEKIKSLKELGEEVGKAYKEAYEEKKEEYEYDMKEKLLEKMKRDLAKREDDRKEFLAEEKIGRARTGEVLLEGRKVPKRISTDEMTRLNTEIESLQGDIDMKRKEFIKDYDGNKK